MFKRLFTLLVGERTSSRIALVVFLLPSIFCLGYALTVPYLRPRVTYEPNSDVRRATQRKLVVEPKLSPAVETGYRVTDATLLLLAATSTVRIEAFRGNPCSSVGDLQNRMKERNCVPPGFTPLPDGGFQSTTARFGIRFDPRFLRIEVYSVSVDAVGPVDFQPPFLVRLPLPPDLKTPVVTGDEVFAEIIWDEGRVRQPGPPPAFLQLSDLKALGWKTDEVRLSARDRKEGIQ